MQIFCGAFMLTIIQSISDFFHNIPVQLAIIHNVLNTKERELFKARLELGKIKAELATNNGICEVLFNLVEKMRALLSLYDQGHAVLQRPDLESVLESAVAQLELQSSKIDCDALRQENSHLRKALQIKNVKEGNGCV